MSVISRMSKHGELSRLYAVWSSGRVPENVRAECFSHAEYFK